MDLLVAKSIKEWPTELATNLSYTVALSGGVDSVVLLHILHNILNAKNTLDVIHINHGISPNADSWSKFCQDLCISLKLKLKICNHTVSKTGGESLENNARKVRYSEFFSHKSDVIVLAHHKTDQVETTLSQIFRGSDLHNIAAMRKLTKKQDKIFWRPFLDISKNELEEYAKRNNLRHITDESNIDNQYLRNFIRNNILPQLQAWDKNIEKKILKTNEYIQNSVALSDEIASNDLEQIKTSQSEISFSKFTNLSNHRQINLISYFILQQSLPLPSNSQIEEFIRQINTCNIDKSPKLKIGDKHEIKKQKQYIIITTKA
jgi:tRNA(Ile)-lysidine synthase